MLLDRKDLDLWVKNYQNYEDMIELLQREIEDLEYQINATSGSFPKVPQGSSSTYKNELFFKIDERMTRQRKYSNRIEEVNKFITWALSEDTTWNNIIMFRCQGYTWEDVGEWVNYSMNGAKKIYDQAIDLYLKQRV